MMNDAETKGRTKERKEEKEEAANRRPRADHSSYKVRIDKSRGYNTSALPIVDHKLSARWQAKSGPMAVPQGHVTDLEGQRD